MIKKPVIVFLGTPEFAVPSLDILFKQGFNIAAVVTSPDKPSGRGLKLSQSPVKQYALSHKLNVLQPEKLRESFFIESLKALVPDIFVVVAFRMLPEEVWSIPALGTFNLHASLLPQYRGAAPVNHAIINGETFTGCTSFMINHEIDTGEIILRQECEILPDDDAGSLHNRLMIIGSKLVLKSVEGLMDNSIKPQLQSSFIKNHEILKPAPRIFKNDCIIDWHRKGVEIINKIRGLSPYPGAYTHISLNNNAPKVLKIFKAEFISGNDNSPERLFFYSNSLEIGCSDGKIRLLEIQIEGKKRMNIASFMRGIKINDLKITKN